MTITRDYARAYLRGLFDGEGTVRASLNKQGKHQLRCISMTNTDKDILDHAARCLDILTIDYTVSARIFANPAYKPAWDINIYGRRNIILFARYVGTSSERKRLKLRVLVGSYSRTKSRYGRFYSGPLFERIKALYEGGMSMSQIAQQMGVNGHEVIRRALHRNGVRVMHYTPSDMARRRWHSEE
jgi:hypothetical protein